MASFYGGYDLVERARPIQHKWSPILLLVAVTALVLLVFIAADVSAIAALPVAVHVSVVEWYAGIELLTTAPGFTMHSSQTVTLSLTCNFICYEITGATVNAPFHLTGFEVAYAPIQYVNASVTAPSSTYSGPLAITLT